MDPTRKPSDYFFILLLLPISALVFFALFMLAVTITSLIFQDYLSENIIKGIALLLSLSIVLSCWKELFKNIFKNPSYFIEQVSLIIHRNYMSYDEARKTNETKGWDVNYIKGFKLSENGLEKAVKVASKMSKEQLRTRLYRINAGLILWIVMLIVAIISVLDKQHNQDTLFINWGGLFLILFFLVYLRMKIKKEERVITNQSSGTARPAA